MLKLFGWPIVAVAALFLTAFTPVPVLAWVQSTSSTGAALHWEDPCITIYFNDLGIADLEGDSEFDALVLSLQAWNAPECSRASLSFGGKTNSEITGYVNENPPINLIIFREEYWPYTEAPVAFTSVSYNKDTGVILDADIEFNAFHYGFTTLGPEKDWLIDLQNTATHELGHVLGLDHSEVFDATMWWQAFEGEIAKRDLDDDDIEGLCTLYPANEEEPACAEVQPQYLHLTPPEDQHERGDGCSVSHTQKAGTGWLAAVALLSLLWALRHSANRRRTHADEAGATANSMPVALAAIVFLSSSPAAGYEFFRSSQGAWVHWNPANCHLSYFVDDSGIDGMPSGEDLAIIQQAVGEWNAIPCAPMELLFGGVVNAPVREADDGNYRNDIIYVRSSWSFGAGDLAMTTLSYDPSSGAIRDADIEVNLQDFQFADCDDPLEAPQNWADFRFVILHEAGHVLGLNHSADYLSAMFVHEPFCDDSPPLQLAADDVDGICEVYGEGTWAETCLHPDVVEEQTVPETTADAIETSEVITAVDEEEPGTPSPCCCSTGSTDPRPAPGGWGLSLVLLALVGLQRYSVRRLNHRSSES